MIRITPGGLLALKPCDPQRHLALFGLRESLTVKQALAAGATVSDLLWVAGKLGLKTECVRFALACAKRVEHLNTDPRVQAALDATAAWLANPSEANRLAATTARAARAADVDAAAWAAAEDAADAWAAAAADAAAWAAAAMAWAAAEDAAEAAWSTARAADAAATAADAAEIDAQRAIFAEIFG